MLMGALLRRALHNRPWSRGKYVHDRQRIYSLARAHDEDDAVVLSIRTWAVWNRDKRLGIFLLVVWPVCWGGGFAISGIVNKSVKCEYALHYVQRLFAVLD